ncbi:MAG: MBL fold metallo-hydrolase [Phycisphaerae bacterium]|jgi:glyoxylase-like metal-dependent hydrolase (beta-lactamase superfamily II)
MNINITTLPQGSYQTNSYVITKTNAPGKCVVIDTGLDNSLLLSHLKNERLTPQALLITHGHLDHIHGIPEMKELFPDMPVYVLEEEMAMLKSPELNMSAYSAIYDDFAVDSVDKTVTDGEIVAVLGFDFRYLHIPGHTKGGACIEMVGEGRVFTGDCIFCGSIGRTDFPGLDPQAAMMQLVKGIKEKVLTMPEQTILYPGHGPETTVGREKLTNPFLCEQQ